MGWVGEFGWLHIVKPQHDMQIQRKARWLSDCLTRSMHSEAFSVMYTSRLCVGAGAEAGGSAGFWCSVVEKGCSQWWRKSCEWQLRPAPRSSFCLRNNVTEGTKASWALRLFSHVRFTWYLKILKIYLHACVAALVLSQHVYHCPVGHRGP